MAGMNVKTEEKKGTFDTVLLALALAIIVGSIALYYIYEEYSHLYRVIGMLAMIGMAIAVVMRTQVGRSVWAFGVNSRTEVRKVVWPTRQEAGQTTLMVFIMVFLMGVILWLVDMSLASIVRVVTGV